MGFSKQFSRDSVISIQCIIEFVAEETQI